MSNQTDAQKIAEGFISYLEKSGNGVLLSQVVEILSKKVDGGETRATVFSAAPLSSSQKKMIEEILEKQFEISGSQFELDEDLIGGIKVVLGNRVLDLSFKSKLDQLTQ